MRTITITEVEDNYFNVVCGNGFVSGLCWDECLGAVAKLILEKSPDPKKPLSLQSFESHWEMEARIREEIMSHLRPVDLLLLAEKAREARKQ